MQSNPQPLSSADSLPTDASVQSSIQVNWAIKEQDRHDVYRLRYKVLVDQMRLTMLHADYNAKMLTDPQDPSAHILLARDSNTNQCVGTLRNNILGEGDVGVYEELLGLEKLSSNERNRASVTSKLVISSEHRHHRLLTVRLAIAMYIFAIDKGIVVDHVAVRPNHVKFYAHLGYQRYKDKVVHPDGGTLCPLRVEVQDYKYLESVCKPFPGVFRECMDRRHTRLVH